MFLDSNSAAPLPTPEEMAAWDRRAMDEYGLTSALLMENACRAALDVCLEELGDLDGLQAVCFAGPGNNGGDALGLARHLANYGVEVLILLAKPQAKATGAAAYHLRLAKKLGIPCKQLKNFDMETLFTPDSFPDLVVDGLLGTGFKGELREEYQDWIEDINALGDAGAFILALDAPSGLNGLTGLPQPTAVMADATVSFHAAKLGLALPQAEPWVGDLLVAEIGIPPQVELEQPAEVYELLPGIVNHFPELPPTGHKGQAGRVLIVGGSPGLSGAVVLAALGALRAGAGLVTVACPGGLAAEIKSGFPECMTLPLGTGQDWDEADLSPLMERLPSFDALVVGNGMGRNEAAGRILDSILGHSRPPAVLDADALYHLAQDPALWTRLDPTDLLTPHPGEAARLLNCSTDQVQTDRLAAVRGLAEKSKAVAVLKGAGTLVRQETGPSFLYPVASPSLAVGGSGDVLAGVAGALLARSLDTDISALLAVYWHGAAGQVLDDEYPHRGNLAREIADALPRAMEQFHDYSQEHHEF